MYERYTHEVYVVGMDSRLEFLLLHSRLSSEGRMGLRWFQDSGESGDFEVHQHTVPAHPF